MSNAREQGAEDEESEKEVCVAGLTNLTLLWNLSPGYVPTHHLPTTLREWCRLMTMSDVALQRRIWKIRKPNKLVSFIQV